VSNPVRTRLLEEILKYMTLAADAAEQGAERDFVDHLKQVRRVCEELDRIDGKPSDGNPVIAWVDSHLNP
jgi:hypothetical protein